MRSLVEISTSTSPTCVFYNLAMVETNQRNQRLSALSIPAPESPPTAETDKHISEQEAQFVEMIQDLKERIRSNLRAFREFVLERMDRGFSSLAEESNFSERHKSKFGIDLIPGFEKRLDDLVEQIRTEVSTQRSQTAAHGLGKLFLLTSAYMQNQDNAAAVAALIYSPRDYLTPDNPEAVTSSGRWITIAQQNLKAETKHTVDIRWHLALGEHKLQNLSHTPRLAVSREYFAIEDETDDTFDDQETTLVAQHRAGQLGRPPEIVENIGAIFDATFTFLPAQQLPLAGIFDVEPAPATTPATTAPAPATAPSPATPTFDSDIWDQISAALTDIAQTDLHQAWANHLSTFTWATDFVHVLSDGHFLYDPNGHPWWKASDGSALIPFADVDTQTALMNPEFVLLSWNGNKAQLLSSISKQHGIETHHSGPHEHNCHHRICLDPNSELQTTDPKAGSTNMVQSGCEKHELISEKLAALERCWWVGRVDAPRDIELPKSFQMHMSGLDRDERKLVILSLISHYRSAGSIPTLKSGVELRSAAQVAESGPNRGATSTATDNSETEVSRGDF